MSLNFVMSIDKTWKPLLMHSAEQYSCGGLFLGQAVRGISLVCKEKP